MKKKLSLILVLALCMSICLAPLVVEARQASGRCAMSSTGRNVSFSGYSSSAQIEDVISVTVILWEQRGTTWYEVARSAGSLQNTDYVSSSSSKTVTGGYYYKVSATHYSMKGGTSYSVTSETASKLIP